MKSKLFITLVIVFALTSCSVKESALNEDYPAVDLDTDDNINSEEVINVNNVTFNTLKVEWPIYQDVENLVEASDIILLGKVTDISFQLFEDGTGSDSIKEADNSMFYTLYTVKVLKSYKGDISDSIQVRMLGGRKDAFVADQINALGNYAKSGIPIVDGTPEIHIDETYLFVLAENDVMLTLLSSSQGAYNFIDPYAKDSFSYLSLKDIVIYFGEDKWDEIKNNGLYGAIFERNGEICYFDYPNKTIIVLSGGGKYDPVLSPDMTKILFRRSVWETKDNTLWFGAIDTSGKPIIEFKVASTFSNDILECQWISDNLVGITTHVNPSTSEYFIYDITSGLVKDHFVGYSFVPIPGTEKVIYADNVPHWNSEPVYHTFILDGKTVYTSDILSARLSPPVFSSDLKTIAFMEYLPEPSDPGEGRRIIVADFDLDNLVIQNTRSIYVPNDVLGKLIFDENDNICISDDYLIFRYDESAVAFIQEDVDLFSSKPYAELQEAVRLFWGDDSLVNINFITWIL